jgi:thioesterase domain-containing protein/acyl carrier protein
LSPVPIGARGELFLGGLSVAEGYLGNEELTQQKFVLDQFDAGVFGARSEPRMYRTGDIVAWRDDGQLRFFGRNDFQLKVRGFRVELGEIENAIRQHPLVQDVVVDAHFGNGEPTIAAYIVSNGPSALNTLTIRQYLSNSVPEYMLPSHVICLDEIPLTVSGKIDRKSLPAPDTEAELLNEFVAPSSATEVQLANIVRSVLHKDRISANDNFFQIGGNSLLALRLTSQIRKQFSVDLPLVQLFQSPTLASLAKLIDAFGAQTPNASDDPLMSLAAFQSTTADIKSSIGSGASSLVTLRDSAIGSPIFCIHGLGGHIVNFIPLSRELKTDRPIVGIQGVGVDGQNAPHEGIEEMARYYARQIITRQPSGPVQVVGWSMGGLIAMEIARELQSHGRCAHDLIMLDTHLSLADRSLEEVTEESVIKQIAPRVGLSIKNLRRLTIEQQWEHVLEASQQYTGSKHSDGNADEIRRLAEMCKSHLIAIGRYQPKRIEKKIFMLQAARPWRLADPRWRLLCTGFASETVAGSHYSMLASPDVQQVCRAIEKILESNCIKDGERS